MEGGTTSFEVVLTWELEVLAILMGGPTNFHPLKGGGVAKCAFVILVHEIDPVLFSEAVSMRCNILLCDIYVK